MNAGPPARGQVSGRRAARVRRHGRGAPRSRPPARPRRGDQDAAHRPGPRRHLPDAVPPRGAERRVAQPPGDRRRLRHRRGARRRPARRLPYIVMEFVNGRTLKEVLTAEGALMPRRALEISADICAALEFSHRHGIIHRDIKPGNVMLTQTGQVKVMDFGIARALASGAQHDDPDRGGDRHRPVPVARAGARRGGRRPLRRLLHRLRAVRAAHRPPAVRRRQPGRRRLPARAGGRRSRRASQPRRAAGRSTRSC